MRKSLSRLIALTSIIANSVASATQLYTVNRAVGGDTVAGTILTDGTLGVLHTSNIQGFLFTFTGLDFTSPTSISFTDASAFYSIDGNAFTATASDLSFDFSGASGPGSVFFSASGTSWRFSKGSTIGPTCGIGSFGQECIFGSSLETVLYSAPQLITAAPVVAVPEPETDAMLLAGLGLLGFMARRKNAA